MFLCNYLKKDKNMKMDEKDLVTVTRCGVCGSQRFLKLDRYSTAPAIYLVKCAGCGAVTYDRHLSQEKTNETYENYEYYDDAADESGCVTFYGYDRFARHLYKLFMHAGGGGAGKREIS